MTWVLALSIVLNAATACAALWILWGCVRILKAAIGDQSHLLMTMQARWVAQQLASKGDASLAGQALGQADGEQRASTVPFGVRHAWDQVADLSQ